MGDISTEPSMEEILSSIKRIIAEEGDASASARPRRAARPAPLPTPVPVELDEDDDSVLELSEELSAPEPALQPVSEAPYEMPEPKPETPAAKAEAPAPAASLESIVSDRAAEAMRGPLAALSRAIEKPAAPAPSPAPAPGGVTVEAMVSEMLKPMLREWLDANLPDIVERLVAREIERITGRN